MITERMIRAREKDEQSLRLFNQLRERRGTSVRMRLSHGPSFLFILIFMAQVAYSRTADVSSEQPCALSASIPPNVPSSSRVRVEGGQLSSIVSDAQGSPQLVTHKGPLHSIPPKLPTPDSSSTTTATPVLPALVAQVSRETPAHVLSSSIAVPSVTGSSEIPASVSSSTITPPPQFSLETEITEPRGTPSTTVQEATENASFPGDLTPNLPGPSTPGSPLLIATEPPSGSIDVAPLTNPGRGNGTVKISHAQPIIPSSPLPRSEKKAPAKQSQNKINKSPRSASSLKPSAKVTPSSILPSTPKARQSSNRIMPGAYPGMSVDVDISSWVLVSPVTPSVVVPSKTSWISRLFSLRG